MFFHYFIPTAETSFITQKRIQLVEKAPPIKQKYWDTQTITSLGCFISVNQNMLGTNGLTNVSNFFWPFHRTHKQVNTVALPSLFPNEEVSPFQTTELVLAALQMWHVGIWKGGHPMTPKTHFMINPCYLSLQMVVSTLVQQRGCFVFCA